MVTVRSRKNISGFVTYMIRFRRKGIPPFSLTFDDLNVAWKWVDENEDKYMEDPDSYHKWKKKYMKEMQKQKIRVNDNIKKPSRV